MKVRWMASVAGVAAACSMFAASAGAMTISLGTPSLSGRVAITEPVNVTCSPFDPGLVAYDQAVNVSAEQASGRSVAYGSGAGYNFACDGSQYTVPVVVLANTPGVPFHGGSVVLAASAYAEAGTPCGFQPGCFFPPFESQGAGAGPTTLVMH